MVLVRFSDNATDAQTEDAKAEVEGETIEEVDGTDIEAISVEGSVEAAIKEIEDEPGVESAQPSFIYTADYSPNDPRYVADEQYGLDHIRARGAWDATRGGIGSTSNPEIGIIDTGWDRDHPDLSGKVTGEYDCVGDGDPYADDAHGHGTHVAGIAAAKTNNATGIAGTAPAADLFIGRALNSNGTGSTRNIIECANRAVQAGVEVLNFSLGGFGEDQLFADSIQDYVDSGVNVVASAGNNNGCPDLDPNYPASYEGVIGVAATTSNRTRASYSDCGPRVDIAAPGSDILSTVPLNKDDDGVRDGYQLKNGTSMAAPHVAGTLALVRANGRNDEDQAKQRIFDTAEDLGTPGNDEKYGRGLINANAATGSG